MNASSLMNASLADEDEKHPHFQNMQVFALIVLFVATSMAVVSLVIWVLFRRTDAADEGKKGRGMLHHCPSNPSLSVEAPTDYDEATTPVKPPGSVAALPSTENTNLLAVPVSSVRQKFREGRMLIASQQQNYGATNKS